jgi:methanogenic corrinoid protein MtbC1
MAAPDFPEIELALTSTALAGDAGGLYRIASDLMANGVPFDSLLFDYLMATERSVGRRWEQGDYLISEEHAATAAIETVISLLTGMFDQPDDGPLVVVATAQGDDHSLPARAVAAHLLYLGYRTTFLGANVPAEDLRSFLETEPPTAVVVSATMSIHLLGARAVVQAAHEVGVPAVVGGKAFGSEGEWAPAIGADAWAASPREVEQVIEAWAKAAPTLAETPNLPEETEVLASERTAAIARAEAQIAGRFEGPIPRRLSDDLKLLLASVESGLVTGDDRVIAEMLDWLETSLPAHGLEAGIVVDALQAALDSSQSEAGSILARVRAGRPA